MVRSPKMSRFLVNHGHRWKLILGPTEPPAALKNQMSEELPKGKTIVDIFSDFMRYLFDSTKALFLSSDKLGEHRWNSVSDDIELVLTHPNGWGGPQQSKLRTAAVQANIVPDTSEGHNRVHFVTEGEASFHFCAAHTQEGEKLKVWHYWCHFPLVLPCLTCQQHGDRVLIVDAGGGTIDISSYLVTDNLPLQVKELFQSKCRSACPRLPMRLLTYYARFIAGRRIRHREGKGGGHGWVRILTVPFTFR